MFKLEDHYVKFWTRSDEEFEALRAIVLNDASNKNIKDFTKQKFVIEDHVGYGVIFNRFTHAPVTMSGLKEIEPGVGRLLNRHYIFPESRNKTYADIVSGLYTIRKLIMEPLIERSRFKVHILSMPNRGKRNNFFDAFHKTHNDAWPDHWYRVNGYYRTGNGIHNPHSWQNILTDDPTYPFDTITQEQWESLVD